jgi:hypothetical protein
MGGVLKVTQYCVRKTGVECNALQCGSWESTVHAKACGPGNAKAVLLCAVNTGPTRYRAIAEATPADTSIGDGEKTCDALIAKRTYRTRYRPESLR